MKAIAYQTASGTVCGAEHLGSLGVPSDSNNQDSSLVHVAGNSLIAVVSDGCSDRRESAVGAALLCRFFSSAAEHCLPRLKKVGQGASFAAEIQKLVVEKMQSACALCAPPGLESRKAVAKAADELFLCTLVGTVLTPDVTVVLAAGDGVWGVNAPSLTSLGPFPNNEPPYLGYLLRGNPPVTPKLSVVFEGPTRDIERLAIGSDGCEDIPAEVLEKILTSRVMFENPEWINRELRKLNSQTVTLDGALERQSFRVSPRWTERQLDDDTTLIVVEPEFHSAAAKAARPRGNFLSNLLGGASPDAH